VQLAVQFVEAREHGLRGGLGPGGIFAVDADFHARAEDEAFLAEDLIATTARCQQQGQQQQNEKAFNKEAREVREEKKSSLTSLNLPVNKILFNQPLFPVRR
jgi:hypothetical protein